METEYRLVDHEGPPRVLTVEKNGQTVAHVTLTWAGESFLAHAMTAKKDPRAMRMLIKAVIDVAKESDTMLTVEARNEDALRLLRLYIDFGARLEYLMLKVVP